MPRRPRIQLADHPQHIVQRGHNRAACFFAEEDYRFTLHGLKPGAEKVGCAVHAWALMTNPVHRLLTPDAPNGISQLMQSLGRRDARYVNRFHKRSGSVWEGRFKSSLIKDWSQSLNRSSFAFQVSDSMHGSQASFSA